MDRAAIKRTFLAINEIDREMVLLRVLYNLTIAMRDIFHTQGDNQKLNASITFSEINHKTLAFLIALRVNKPHYSDDVFIDIVLDEFSKSYLANYLSQIWDTSFRAINSP
jgi:hypothetical protein